MLKINRQLCLPPKGRETYCFSPCVCPSVCLSVRLSVCLSVTNRVRSISQKPSDIALGILGANPIMAEIDKKKLIFFGQLCRLSPEVIHNQILNQRLFSVFQTPGPKYGFVPDILRIVDNIL